MEEYIIEVCSETVKDIKRFMDDELTQVWFKDINQKKMYYSLLLMDLMMDEYILVKKIKA